MSSFLSKSFYDFENRLLPNDYIVIRNHGEDQGVHKGWLGGVEDQLGRPSQGLQACFKVQDQRGVKWMLRMHLDSIFDVLPMLGNSFISKPMALV